MIFFNISGLTTLILLFFATSKVLSLSKDEAIEIAQNQIEKTSLSYEVMSDLIIQAIITIDRLEDSLNQFDENQFKILIINPMIDEKNIQKSTATKSCEDQDFALALQIQEEENNQQIPEPPTKKARTNRLKTEHPLPTSLNGIPLVHLNAPEKQHGDASCGSRALLTTYAIEDAVKQQKAITQTNLLSVFNLKKNLVYQTTDVTGAEIVEKNKILKVNNVFLTDKDTTSIICCNNISQEKIDENAIHNAITEVNMQSGTLHFIINTGGHWVLLSYVKEPEANPILIYIDSVNHPLLNDSVATQVVKTLWDRYFAVYCNSL